ncbi:cytoskeletal protein RodZ [Salirhabdus euzebyi]|uniref:Cytoskeletal protein RodZ n=1 Tax=Salirhabdus euzebyi TaxID=394506 RepID=A0A841Q389_9BACI|nr:helix-turn-helix domain-containing protein [Salirhabdus euzebyi]MBB6452854.1 cytoskeletal protein RodZ [Salirhabdus euzebyi]
MELGEKLKEARINKELSLEEIQEKTKIQKRYLEAIEAGNLTVLPGSFYTRAFIREFALTVGLNPDQLLEEHQNELPTSKEENYENLSRAQKHTKRAPDKNSAFFSVFPKILTAVLIIGILAVVWYFYQDKVDPQDNNVDEDQNELIEYNRSEEAQPPAEEEEEEVPEVVETPEPEPVEEEPKTVLELVDQNASGTPSSVFEMEKTDEFIIQVETEANSWLDVKNGKGKVFYSDNFTADQSPQTFDLSGEQEVRLNIGRAVDLTVTINGAVVEYPHDPNVPKNYHQIVTVKVKE